MDQELTHFGIKGMKWGVRRTPEQLGHKVERLKKKNTALEKRAVAGNVSAARYKKRAYEYDRKYMKRIGYATSDSAMQKAQKLKYKANAMQIKSAKFEAVAARANAKVYKNERMIEALNTKISELNSQSVELGSKAIETKASG